MLFLDGLLTLGQRVSTLDDPNRAVMAFRA
jgi:hypothetical protein